MSFDQKRSDQFGDRIVGTLNEAALSLMISIGHRLGLFDLLTEQPPCTSEELARRANCNERYIREWLGAMVTGRIMDYDPELRRYSLPQEHAVFLARKFSPNNVALFAQYIPLLGAVEDDILHCFRNGGGVPYEKYPRFHEVMAEDSGQCVLSSLFSHILPLIPGLSDRLERGIRVLDVGCGRGRALLLMAERYPKSEFHGIDLSEVAIAYGTTEANRLGLSNIRFTASDLSRFDREAKPESYDFVTTFDAVHDQANPRSVLKGIQRSLTADGVYMMQDINASSHVHQNMDHPIGTLLYTVSCLHCMTVSLAQGGEGLGAMWGREKAHELLKEAGFSKVEVHRLAHDIQNEYYVIRK